jgi:hypothetical protein
MRVDCVKECLANCIVTERASKDGSDRLAVVKYIANKRSEYPPLKRVKEEMETFLFYNMYAEKKG